MPLYFVKQVIRGDNVVLMDSSRSKDIFVHLSYVKAPYLGNKARARDEPYAWESREFMRKRIVGNRVFFVRDYYGSNGREFGQILFGSEDIHKCKNIAELAIQAGWLETKPGKQLNEVARRYLALQEQAISDKVGKWNKDPAESAAHIRDVKYNVENTAQFVSQHKGKPVKAIIENVHDGSSFRAYVPSVSTYVNFVLTGVRCPAVGRQEPFAKEAKSFVEVKLLNREIDLLVEGANNTRIVASIAHHAGNIAVLILQEGYGKCVDWSVGIVTGGGTLFREAERKAKEARRCVWKDWDGAKVIKVGHKRFNGENDIFICIDTGSGEETNYYLSYVKAPKDETPKDEASGSEDDAIKTLYCIPYMFECREFLRKKLIGKKVEIIVDYVQNRTRNYATIIFDNENIGETLIKNGFATVLEDNKDIKSYDKAQYDLLITAEKKAEKDEVNLWSKKVIEPHFIHNINRKQILSILTCTTTKLTGIVEEITLHFGFVVYIPKERILIKLSLSGIIFPETNEAKAGKTKDEKPFDSTYLAKYFKEKVYQREIEFKVDSVVKSKYQTDDVYISHIFFDYEGKSTNLSKLLTKDYLAKFEKTDEKIRLDNKFYNANVTKPISYDKKNFGGYTVLSIDPKTLAIRIGGNNFKNQLKDFEDKLKNVVKLSPKINLKTSLNENKCYMLNLDTKCCRVRVVKNMNQSLVVYYIDGGYSEIITYTDEIFKELPDSVNENILPPLATEIRLAFITAPNDEYYKKRAIKRLSDILPEGKLIDASSKYRVGDQYYFTVSVDQDDVGKKLIDTGFFISKKRSEPKSKTIFAEYKQVFADYKQVFAEYEEAEKDAKLHNLGIWKYGDLETLLEITCKKTDFINI